MNKLKALCSHVQWLHRTKSSYPPLSDSLKNFFFQSIIHTHIHTRAQNQVTPAQLNRFPRGGRNGCVASYFDFSNNPSASVSGSCRVGAGSWPASLLGEATSSLAVYETALAFARCKDGSSVGFRDSCGSVDAAARRRSSASIAASWALRIMSAS